VLETWNSLVIWVLCSLPCRLDSVISLEILDLILQIRCGFSITDGLISVCNILMLSKFVQHVMKPCAQRMYYWHLAFVTIKNGCVEQIESVEFSPGGHKSTISFLAIYIWTHIFCVVLIYKYHVNQRRFWVWYSPSYNYFYDYFLYLVLPLHWLHTVLHFIFLDPTPFVFLLLCFHYPHNVAATVWCVGT
jgi:hypothetical protein